MKFKDAAYQILKSADHPLHYTEITDAAISRGLLETEGQTPHATMGALLYTDTLTPDSRFRRGDEKGTFSLKVAPPASIQQQINTHQTQLRHDLIKYLHKVPAQKFEELIRSLLETMGFEETETTPYSNDKGVDVRGILRPNQLSTIKIAIQAKRWNANVGANVVRELRGSLKAADAEHGLIITPSDFTSEAKAEARAEGKTPITLINGVQLVDLLVKFQVGVKQEQYVVPAIDEEYWSEVLGVSIGGEDHSSESSQKRAHKVDYPVKIQATFKENVFTAELLNARGEILYKGTRYSTPSSAAKAVATSWKQVNGWVFWHYFDKRTKKWQKIDSLR